MNKIKLLIAGGTGLIGSRLVELIDHSKYEVAILSRSKHADTKVNYIQWDINSQRIDSEALNYPYIINLTGAGIADKIWSASRKKILIDSRVKSTELLLNTFKENNVKIKSYVGASAIGFYGDRGEEELNVSSSSKGEGFMVECCRLWEQAHMTVKESSEAWSMVRIGIVLSTKGGAFAKMHPPMKMGVASYFGNGAQYYSWIHIDDISRLLLHAVNKELGVVNGVAPEPKTNKQFMKEIKNGLKSSALLLPAPAFGLRLVFGEMADVILNSNRVIPDKLLNDKFHYQFPELAAAAADIVNRGV